MPWERAPRPFNGTEGCDRPAAAHLEDPIRLLLLVPGLLLVLGASLDALWTTLWLEGHAGPVAGRATGLLHLGALRLTGARQPRRTVNHRLLSLEGPLLLIATLWLWVMMTWAGWVLAFSASPGAVVDAHSHVPATLVERVYFVGYTMFTMGNGDFTPRGGGWQVATALASFTGFAMISLAITYQLQVLSAVVRKRSFASQVFALGDHAEEMVLNLWDGHGFPSLDLQLVSLAGQLQQVTEQHRAYPMLHWYRAERRRDSSAVAVAALDEALLLLRWGLAPEARPTASVLRLARESVGGFLATLRESTVTADDTPPPPPSLARLRDAGLPVVDDAAFARAVGELRERRRLLRGVLEGDVREWPPAA